jgi:hypothetical protein
MRRHRAAVGIGQQDLVLAGPLKLSQHRLVTAALLAQRLDLLGEIVRARPARRRAVFDVARVEPRQIVIQPLVGGPDELAQRTAGEIAILVVDRLDAGSVHGEQLASVEVEPPTQQHELTKRRAERRTIVAPKVGDGLEVGPEATQQPDDLNVAMGFALHPAASRSKPIRESLPRFNSFGYRSSSRTRCNLYSIANHENHEKHKFLASREDAEPSPRSACSTARCPIDLAKTPRWRFSW